MNVFTLLSGHLRVSLQDLGRKQNLHLGIPTSGAADEHAFLTANTILANATNAPALEITLGNVKIKAEADCTMVFACADSEYTFNINGEPVDSLQIIHLYQGDIIDIPAFKTGVYGYLAIAGGFKAESWLNSCISAVQHKPTSFEAMNVNRQSFPASPINIEHYQRFYAQQHIVVRFMPNDAWFELTPEQQQALSDTIFSLDRTSNKMGYRLNSANKNTDIFQRISQHCGQLSKPVNYGQIQLPSDNQTIVLMKDCQTMGGYPTIGCVMKTDLFRLSQITMAQTLSFTPISVEKAQVQLNAFYQKFTCAK